MNRDNHDEQFIPETVDEQVAMLLQVRDQHYFRAHSNARLTHDLAIIHQEQKQILERALQRLATHPSVIQASTKPPSTQYERAQPMYPSENGPQQTWMPAYPPSTQNERNQPMYPNMNRSQQQNQARMYPPAPQHERTQHMYPKINPPQRRQRRQRQTVLIASLVALLLVGSSLTAFALLRLRSGQTSTTLTPTVHATSAATHSPTLSPTVIPQVQTNCPATGTARAAVIPPLPAGSHQGVLYVTDKSSGSNRIGVLSRYDVATGQKTDLLTITVPGTLQNNQSSPGAFDYSPRLSANGQWIVFQTVVERKEAIQLVRADGQELQTLYCTTTDNDLWNTVSFSPDAKYVTFEEVSIYSKSSPKLMILELATGKLQVAAQVSQMPAIYEPIKWRDNTSLYANYSLIGVGDTRNRHQVYLLPDVTQNSTPQKISIPTISGASNDICKDFDFNPDNTQLLVSDCTGDARGLTTGPSTIETVPLTGGTPHVIHTSQHGISYARFLTNTTIWFSVDDTVNTNQNGLWKINTDGSGLTQLTTKGASFEDLAYDPAMHISSDNAMFAVEVGNASISIGSLNGGNTTTIGSSGFLVGWTTF